MTSPHIAIIDYGSGNLRSVAKAVERVAGGARVAVTSEASVLTEATHVILPGVGAFADCMQGLTALPGMVAALKRHVQAEKKPFLGVCVGMQLLFARGHEHGTHAGLGWLKGEVTPLAPADPVLKIPHMGWNYLHVTQPAHPLWRGIAEGSMVYFVHSFAASGVETDDIIATCDYGGHFPAAVARGNIMGVQFHPEKSQGVGLRIVENFLACRV